MSTDKRSKAKRRRPTPAELNERITVPLETDEFVEGILQAGPHHEGPPEAEEAARQESEYPADETDEG